MDLVLTARWVFPGNGPPIERGTVAVGNGLITAVEPPGMRTPDVDLGNSAIIPGLVNAHTHLDLSGMAGRTPPGPDFAGWLQSIIAQRRRQAPEQVLRDIRAGAEQALKLGTTLLGDIAVGGASRQVLANVPCWSVVFREIIGLSWARGQAAWNDSSDWLEVVEVNALPRSGEPGEACRLGLSPHAPFSVHHSIFQLAARRNVPLSIHFAESADEHELLEHHRGPLADFLREVGAWDEEGLAPSLDWIVEQASRAPSTLLVHANYLPESMRFPANAHIVYCPRTHAAFGHPPHSPQWFQSLGGRIALGTDSLASNPDLDVLAEACFLRERHPDLPGELLLKMATQAGAEALGFGRLTGSLECGKSADLVVVPLPDVDSADPYRLLFGPDLDLRAPRQTMWRGAWRSSDPD